MRGRGFVIKRISRVIVDIDCIFSYLYPPKTNLIYSIMKKLVMAMVRAGFIRFSRCGKGCGSNEGYSSTTAGNNVSIPRRLG